MPVGISIELQWFEGQPRDVALPRISMMLMDDRDRLWVKKYDPSTDSHLIGPSRCRGGEWLIMETSGEVVATIDLPEGFLLLDVRGDRLLGKVQDRARSRERSGLQDRWVRLKTVPARG